MGTPELVQAASRIAGGMIATEEAHMTLSPGRLNEIARMSVQLARMIEADAIASSK
jgi:hypothetical protein